MSIALRKLLQISVLGR